MKDIALFQNKIAQALTNKWNAEGWFPFIKDGVVYIEIVYNPRINQYRLASAWLPTRDSHGEETKYREYSSGISCKEAIRQAFSYMSREEKTELMAYILGYE